MTIKQILIGGLVGSAVVGFMVQRVHTSREIQARSQPRPVAVTKIARHKAHGHKTASAKKSPWFKKRREKNSDTELSSRKLYGR